MRLLYYVPAIGNNNYDIKKNILIHNLTYLYQQLKEPIDIILNVYDEDTDFFQELRKNKIINNCYIHCKKGILVELWKSNPYHNLINNYDMIFLNYDDVELKYYKIHDLLNIMNKYNIDIISPLVEGATYQYMRTHYQYDIIFTNMIEIYSLLMKPKTFLKYLDYQDIENKWTWGSDLLLGYYGFKNALYSRAYVKHHFPQNNENLKKEAYLDMYKYINKFGFKTVDEIYKKFPLIIGYIK